jgi:hypothetical protein
VSNPVVLINARDVAEAVAAAPALTPDLDQQVEITAGLMGLSPDEARPFVREAPSLNLRRSAAPQRGQAGTEGGPRSAGPVVIVERRSRLAAHELRSVGPHVWLRQV